MPQYTNTINGLGFYHNLGLEAPIVDSYEVIVEEAYDEEFEQLDIEVLDAEYWVDTMTKRTWKGAALIAACTLVTMGLLTCALYWAELNSLVRIAMRSL
jgi:hypothetical protein